MKTKELSSREAKELFEKCERRGLSEKKANELFEKAKKRKIAIEQAIHEEGRVIIDDRLTYLIENHFEVSWEDEKQDQAQRDRIHDALYRACACRIAYELPIELSRAVSRLISESDLYEKDETIDNTIKAIIAMPWRTRTPGGSWRKPCAHSLL